MKIAGLIGIASAAASFGAAQASTSPAPAGSEILKAQSFADLLGPIPNAVAALKASNASIREQRAAVAETEVAQLYFFPHRHHHHFYHHHHHHHFYHHHHHHHYYHHHHHHHHHHDDDE